MATMHYSTSSGAGTSIVFYPGQPERVRENGKLQFEWKGWCLTASVGTAVPADDTAMSAAPTLSSITGASSYKLATVRVSQSSAPNVSEVTLTYTLEGAAPGRTVFWKSGDVERRLEVIPAEVSSYSPSVPSGEADHAMAEGANAVTEPRLRYTYAIYDSSFTWSEANMIASALGTGVGGVLTTTTPPPGMTGTATAYTWKFFGRQLTETKGLTRKEEVWEYNAKKWSV